MELHHVQEIKNHPACQRMVKRGVSPDTIVQAVEAALNALAPFLPQPWNLTPAIVTSLLQVIEPFMAPPGPPSG